MTRSRLRRVSKHPFEAVDGCAQRVGGAGNGVFDQVELGDRRVCGAAFGAYRLFGAARCVGGGIENIAYAKHVAQQLLDL